MPSPFAMPNNKPHDVEVVAYIDRHDASGVYRIRLVLPNGVELFGNEVYPNIPAAKEALADIAKHLKAELHYGN